MISTSTIVLIVHVLAVFVMTAVLAIEAIALVHMRGAASPAEALPWINPVPRLSLFAVASIFLILFTGAYLVMQEAASQQAWGHVAGAAVLLMMPLGAMTGKRMRAIRRGFDPGMEKNEGRMERLRDPFLKVSLCIRCVVFLAIFLLVSMKPGTLLAIEMIVAGNTHRRTFVEAWMEPEPGVVSGKRKRRKMNRADSVKATILPNVPRVLIRNLERIDAVVRGSPLGDDPCIRPRQELLRSLE